MGFILFLVSNLAVIIIIKARVSNDYKTAGHERKKHCFTLELHFPCLKCIILNEQAISSGLSNEQRHGPYF